MIRNIQCYNYYQICDNPTQNVKNTLVLLLIRKTKYMIDNDGKISRTSLSIEILSTISPILQLLIFREDCFNFQFNY